MAIGGPIESVTLNGREFSVAADADSNRNLGGFTNEVQSNGDGSARNIKTRVPWMIDGIAVQIDDSRADQEFLQAISDNPEFVPMAITYVSGVIYQGAGTITGDIATASSTTTAPLTISGPQKLTQQ